MKAKNSPSPTPRDAAPAGNAGTPTPAELDHDVATEYLGSGNHPGNAHAQLGDVPIQNTDNLDETVLGSAAVGNPNAIAPEVTPGTGDLTEWDTPASAEGSWTYREGRDDEMAEAEQLVEAGIEEADREQRVASDEEPDE